MSERALKKGPTGRYGVIQAGYWMNYLIIASFAAVFLTGRGFTTAQVGIVTATGSLLSCVLQQVSGTIADRSSSPLKWLVAGFFAVCMLCFAGLLFLPHAFLSTFVFYVVALTLQASISPLLNALCLQFTNNGYDINFGLARSMGSLGYALSALFMGTITERFGAEIILPIYLAIYAVVMIVLISFPVPQKNSEAKVVAGNELLKNEQPSSMKQFFARYHRFMLLMVGFILLWFLNNILGTYMIYFVGYHGGGQADMGLALSIMAFSEIPAVLFGSNIMGRIGAGKMLRISAFGGILKAVLFFIAPNLQFFIWCNVAHLLLSGFYQVSAVYYCYSIVGQADIVKGQAILGVATTGICAMLSNYLGGILVEAVSIPTILLIGIVVNILAFVVIYIATDPNRFKNETIRNI